MQWQWRCINAAILHPDMRAATHLHPCSGSTAALQFESKAFNLIIFKEEKDLLLPSMSGFLGRFSTCPLSSSVQQCQCVWKMITCHLASLTIFNPTPNSIKQTGAFQTSEHVFSLLQSSAQCPRCQLGCSCSKKIHGHIILL